MIKTTLHTSDLLAPGAEAWIVIGVPEGFLPCKEAIALDPEIGAAFAILGLGGMSESDVRGYTNNTFTRGFYLRVRNDGAAARPFRCVARFAPDTSKLERDLGRLVEETWRDGTRN